jgi:hypothetical protein
MYSKGAVLAPTNGSTNWQCNDKPETLPSVLASRTWSSPDEAPKQMLADPSAAMLIAAPLANTPCLLPSPDYTAGKRSKGCIKAVMNSILPSHAALIYIK